MCVLQGLSASHRVLEDSTAPPLHPNLLAALAAFALQDPYQTPLAQPDPSVKIQASLQSVLLGRTAPFDPRRLPFVYWVSTAL